MKRRMLDTNTVSHLIRGAPTVIEHVIAAPMDLLCLSAITEGELRFGLAKRPDAKGLRRAVEELLKRVDVAPWDSAAAARYGILRATMERKGRGLGPMDLLIASHALSLDAVLVTSDQAFGMTPDLELADWTVANG